MQQNTPYQQDPVVYHGQQPVIAVPVQQPPPYHQQQHQQPIVHQNVAVSVPVRAMDQETVDKQKSDGFAADAPPEGTALTVARALIVIKFIAGLVMLIISILAYAKLKAAADDVVNTADLWKMQPITNITTVSAGASCPAGYAALSPPSFTGTNRVCDCPSNNVPSTGTFKTPGVYVQACNSSQTSWCTEYSALPSQPLYWRGVQLCVKTYADTKMNALNRPRASATKACPSGYQACTGGTTSEVFCAPSTDVCPLTEIKISPTSLAGYTCAPFASGTSSPTMYTCTKTGTSPWPIVKSAFNDYSFSSTVTSGLMCWPGQTSQVQGSSTDIRVNPLLYKCLKTDPRWTVLDSQTSFSVYNSSKGNQNKVIPDQGSVNSFTHAASGSSYGRFLQLPVRLIPFQVDGG